MLIVLRLTTKAHAEFTILISPLFFLPMSMQVLGLVENMNSFICPNCGHGTDIFGREGARRMAEEMQLDSLGEVPLHLSIRETSDTGKPIVVSQPDSTQVRL